MNVMIFFYLLILIIKLIAAAEGDGGAKQKQRTALTGKTNKTVKRSYMLWKLFKRKINDLGALFNGHFVDVKVWYATAFDRVPCVTFIGELDITKAYAHIRELHGDDIVSMNQHNYFDHEQKKIFFNNTVFILTNNRMIELANNYCQVLHTNHQYEWANKLVNNLAEFRMEADKEKENRVIGFARQTEMN
jgi:virulence-associated protein VapD